MQNIQINACRTITPSETDVSFEMKDSRIFCNNII